MNYNILTSITVNEQLLYDKEMKRYNQKYKPKVQANYAAVAKRAWLINHKLQAPPTILINHTS